MVDFNYHVYGWGVSEGRENPQVFIGAHLGGISCDMVFSVPEAMELLSKIAEAIVDAER